MKKLAIVGGGIQFFIMAVTQPFFALYASELGASTALIGFMVTLKAFLPMFIAMPSGQLIDRIGPEKVLKFGCFTTSVSLIAMVFSPNLMVLSMSQIVSGASTLLMASSLQVIVSDGEKNKRDRNITAYSTWSSAGSMAGPLIGGAVVTLAAGWYPAEEASSNAIGYRAAFLVSFLLSFIFWILVSIYSRNTESRKWTVREVGQLLGPKEVFGSYLNGANLLRYPSVQFGLAGTFLIHFIQSIWGSFFPLYLHGLGYGALAIAVLISMRGAASLLSRFFLANLMKWITQERILLGAGCIAALCVIVLPAASANLFLIGLITFILGFSVGINMPVSSMIMVDEAGKNERGKVMGLRLFANRLSQMTGPALFGIVGEMVGMSLALYTGGGFLLATMLGFGAYSRVRDKSVRRATGIAVTKRVDDHGLS